MKVEYSNVYIIDNALYHRLTENANNNKTRYLMKSLIDSVNYNMVSDNTGSESKPSFASLEQVRYGARTSKTMVSHYFF